MRPLLGPLAILGLVALLFRPFWLEGEIFVPGGYLSHLDPWAAGMAPPAHDNTELFDAIVYFYPHEQLLADELRRGRIPLWNPYLFCGHPLVASGQAGLFYPPRLALLATLDPGAARTLLQALHLALMGLGMFGLLRGRGHSPAPALLGGVVWMLNGYAVGWMELGHVPIVMGLATAAMLALERAWAGRPWGYPGAALLAGMVWLGGHLQICLYGTGLIGFYLLWRGWEQRRGDSAGPPPLPAWDPWRGAGALACGVAIGAPAWLPALELLPLSSRRAFSPEELKAAAAPLWALLPTLIHPDAWGNPARGFLVNRTEGNYVAPEFACFAGVLPLVLSLSLLLDRGARRRLAPLAWLVGAGLLAATASPPYLWLARLLPPLQGLLPGRALMVLPFALALLAAAALEALPGSPSMQRRSARIAAGLALLQITWWGGWLAALRWLPARLSPLLSPRTVKIPGAPGEPPGADWQATALAAAEGAILDNPQVALGVILTLGWAIGAARTGRLAPRGATWVAGLTALELGLSAITSSPTVPSSYLFPPVPALETLRAQAPLERVQSLGAAPYNTLMPYALQSVGGYESLVVRRSLDLLDRIEGRAVPMRMGQTTRTDSPLLDLLGVRWSLAPPGERPPADRDGLARIEAPGLTLYRRERTLPRAWAVGRVHPLPDPAALDLISWPGFRPREEAAVAPAPQLDRALRLDRAATGSPVRVLDHAPNRVLLEADMRGRGLVILADTWYPGWQVRVDGQPAEALRVDHTLRGVVVPSGRHRIRWTFEPDSLKAGWALALGGGLAALALALKAGGGGGDRLPPKASR